jgi:hypothetical protein
MCPDDVTPADTVNTPRTTGADGTTDDITDDITDDDCQLDLDPDGAPCLACGQTVPGPHPALLCPDCAAVTDDDTTPVPPRP